MIDIERVTMLLREAYNLERLILELQDGDSTPLIECNQAKAYLDNNALRLSLIDASRERLRQIKAELEDRHNITWE